MTEREWNEILHLNNVYSDVQDKEGISRESTINKEALKEHLKQNHELLELFDINIDSFDLDFAMFKTGFADKITSEEFIYFLKQNQVANLKAKIRKEPNERRKNLLKKKLEKAIPEKVRLNKLRRIAKKRIIQYLKRKGIYKKKKKSKTGNE